MKKVCVFFAEGFEEIEALTVTDLLRRAGADVRNVSVTGAKRVTGSHGIAVETDELFEQTDCTDADILVLPGGMPGTLNLQAHKGLEELLRKCYAQGTYLAAICAAPTVFAAFGFLKGRRACCYPSMEEKLEGAAVCTEPVVKDGTIITSRGLGTAIPFALELTALLYGKEKAEEIGKSVVYDTDAGHE